MRYIKFRVWDFQLKEITSFEEITFLPNEKKMYHLFEDKRYLWMQYTGLKDKNGVEIYEGDIVHYDGKPFNVYALKTTGVIRWYKSAWTLEYKASYKTNDGRDVFNQYHLGCEDFFHKKSVILGNIHQNPELLK